MKPVEAKIAAIVEFPMPTNKRELHRFLGMSGYYRSFCKNFAAIVSPLTDLQEVCVDSRVHGNIQCCKISSLYSTCSFCSKFISAIQTAG